MLGSPACLGGRDMEVGEEWKGKKKKKKRSKWYRQGGRGRQRESPTELMARQSSQPNPVRCRDLNGFISCCQTITNFQKQHQAQAVAKRLVTLTSILPSNSSSVTAIITNEQVPCLSGLSNHYQLHSVFEKHVLCCGRHTCQFPGCFDMGCCAFNLCCGCCVWWVMTEPFNAVSSGIKSGQVGGCVKNPSASECFSHQRPSGSQNQSPEVCS